MLCSFTFLGTGASAGVPIIGCHCPICTSLSPLDHRLRSSGLIQAGGRQFLIDAGPDFRQQALKFGIGHLDGLILTHTHFDHIAGIDDLRVFFVRHKKPIPCLLSKESLEELKLRYHYFFLKGKSSTAQFSFQVLDNEAGETDFEGLKIRYFSYPQGDMLVNGFKIGDFAYVTDIRNYDPAIFDSLKGVKYLVISALSKESTHLHLSVGEAVEFARKVGAHRTWLTHLSHYLLHEETNRGLQPDVQLGYDGLKIEFEV